MKRFLAIALALSLFCVVTAPVPAQEKKETSKHATLLDVDKLGKETFSAKENGIRVQVWLVPRVAVVVLKDVVTNATIDNATVEFTFSSPTKNAATVALAFMHGHYSNPVELTEKGSYQTELRIKRNGRITTLKFNTPVTTI